ncbi:MAG: hypothetical protein NZM37_10120 [Sandaracinaceae bacterium]|nr:hypothetical protein [Sandaracinaceae bacterium]
MISASSPNPSACKPKDQKKRKSKKADCGAPKYLTRSFGKSHMQPKAMRLLSLKNPIHQKRESALFGIDAKTKQ